jgi:hypothetical protein
MDPHQLSLKIFLKINIISGFGPRRSLHGLNEMYAKRILIEPEAVSPHSGAFDDACRVKVRTIVFGRLTFEDRNVDPIRGGRDSRTPAGLTP